MPFQSRRTFLKVGFLSSAVIVMSGCDVFGVTPLRATMAVVQDDLFPKAKELHIDTVSYINKIVLHHSRISHSDKLFIKNGAKWLNEEAVKRYRQMYIKLTKKQREDLLTNIAQTEWGSSWIETMMGYIFEASFGDPIYGANRKEAGWKWLDFVGGKPSPKGAYL